MFLMSMKVFPFSLFKLLKFIIVSFHLALILFVLKIVLVYFCSYIFIWFEYTVNRVCKSLKLIQTVWRRGHGTCIVLKKPKMLLPRSFFADSFFPCDVWNRCQKKDKKSKVYFYVIHLTVTWFRCSRREMCLR